MARNKTSKPKGTTKRKTYSEKMALAAGSLSALYLLPGVAGAAPVLGPGGPVQLALNAPSGTTVTWDVDGVGGHDFEFFNIGGAIYRTIFLASRTATPGSAALNGRGFVGPSVNTDNLLPLQRSFNVGPTLASGYAWGLAPYRYRNAMYGSLGNPPYNVGYDFSTADGFVPGDNFIGFRFLSGGNLHYGWAIINFDVNNGLVTISQWAYETDPDTAIHIADGAAAPIPEPATHTLMLLGFGAAGLLAWRRRKKAQASAAAAS
jgi:hypothetical protein